MTRAALALWACLGVLGVLAADAGAQTFRGTLIERHTDPFANGERMTVSYALRTADDTEIPLTTAQDPALVGQHVAADDASADPGIQGRAGATSSARLAPLAILGPQKVAAVLVSFTNNRNFGFTTDQVRQRIWTASDSANRFFQQQTGGALTLVGRDRADGDIYGPYNLGIAAPTQPGGVCDYESIAAQAKAAAGTDFAGYDHVIYIYPFLPACDFNGLGDLPGQNSWINGDLETKVLAHELGHNMGAHHASSIACHSGSARVAISGNCDFSEYGDPFDAMADTATLMSAFHRAQIGELAGSQQQNVTTTGSYSLSSIDTVLGGGPQLITIPRRVAGQSTTTLYALDIRSPASPFAPFNAGDPAVNGVTIRVVAPITTVTETRLVDTNPATTTFTDAPLGSGKTFSDPDYGITIQNLSSAAGLASLQITVPVLPDTSPPSVPADLAATVSAGSVILTWGASSDDVAFDHYEVFRNSALLASTQATTFTDTNFAGIDTGNYQIVAVDQAGNRAPSKITTVALPHSAAPVQTTGPTLSTTNTKTTLAVTRSSSPVVLKSPKLKRDRAALPASGRLVFSSKGAKLMRIKLGNSPKVAKQARSATMSFVLPRSYRSRTAAAHYFKVTATGVRQARTIRLKIYRGTLTKVSSATTNT